MWVYNDQWKERKKIFTSLNGPPFPKMPRHHLFRLLSISRLLNPANIQRPILPIETTHTSHIISIIRKLIPRETVFGAIWHGIRRIRKSVSILALPTVRTAASGKEEANIFHACSVGACEPRVTFDGASGLWFSFTRYAEEWLLAKPNMNSEYVLRVTIFSISSCPFVIPNI